MHFLILQAFNLVIAKIIKKEGDLWTNCKVTSKVFLQTKLPIIQLHQFQRNLLIPFAYKKSKENTHNSFSSMWWTHTKTIPSTRQIAPSTIADKLLNKWVDLRVSIQSADSPTRRGQRGDSARYRWARTSW